MCAWCQALHNGHVFFPCSTHVLQSRALHQSKSLTRNNLIKYALKKFIHVDFKTKNTISIALLINIKCLNFSEVFCQVYFSHFISFQPFCMDTTLTQTQAENHPHLMNATNTPTPIKHEPPTITISNFSIDPRHNASVVSLTTAGASSCSNLKSTHPCRFIKTGSVSQGQKKICVPYTEQRTVTENPRSGSLDLNLKHLNKVHKVERLV